MQPRHLYSRNAMLHIEDTIAPLIVEKIVHKVMNTVLCFKTLNMLNNTYIDFRKENSTQKAIFSLTSY